jgi:hypothetical protein
MRSIKKYYAIIFILTAVALSSCINMEQKTVLNPDGSGTMQIHYWTHNSNITAEEVIGFGFTDYTVKKNYTSENSEPTDIIIERIEADTTTHVRLNLKFRDIERLPEAKSFSKIRAEWDLDEKDGTHKLTYILLQDSINALSPGMNEFNLVHEFTMPGEVLETNGNQSGSTILWENTIADLINPVFMNAKVQVSDQNVPTGKSCGLFGMELPILGFLILLVLRSRRK